MIEKLIKGQIENVSTGHMESVERYLLPIDFRLTTIIKIVSIKEWLHPDSSRQVSVHCKALDSIGAVFDLDIEFFPTRQTERDKIIGDLKIGSIFSASGKYGIIRGSPITIFNPDYWEVEDHSELKEDEIRVVFQVNSE